MGDDPNDFNINDIAIVPGVGAALLICILYIIVSSLLIHGARKGKGGLLDRYLVITVLSMISEVGYFISGCVQDGFIVRDFIGVIISIALQVFFFICVFSLAQKIKEESRVQGGLGMQKI